MSKCYILDEQNNHLFLTNNETLFQINSILKQGIIENGIIHHNNKSYEYIEINEKDEKLIILKEITIYYKKILENKKLFEIISQLKEENKFLKKDNLTKTYRVDYAMKLVRKYILNAKKNNINFSIVMADIDKFKNINDTYGHEFGNKVLEQIGVTILNNVKNQKQNNSNNNNFDGPDIVIRYGGEEFLILYKNITLDDTIDKVEQIRNEISNLNVDNVSVNMSFGIYNVDMFENNDEIDENNIYKVTSKMVELADKALYYSKENGRNRTSYYDLKTNSCINVKQYAKVKKST